MEQAADRLVGDERDDWQQQEPEHDGHDRAGHEKGERRPEHGVGPRQADSRSGDAPSTGRELTASSPHAECAGCASRRAHGFPKPAAFRSAWARLETRALTKAWAPARFFVDLTTATTSFVPGLAFAGSPIARTLPPAALASVM